MGEADKRVQELLERWGTSLELHARYRQLDDGAYARAENWPKHQRPTAWVIDLASQRLREIRGQVAQRQQDGDTTFAEALELMSFLTGLLGAEHLERFIPLATGKPPGTSVSATVQQPRLRPTRPRAPTAASSAHREPAIPRKSAPPRAPEPQPPAAPEASRAPRPPAAQPKPAPAPQPKPVAGPQDRQVIADAVRMLEWGREWPALAGLIARMADRPGEAEIWQILRAHRTEILAKAGHPKG